MKVLNPSLVKWMFPWILWHGDRKKSSIYLTFDDGPHPEYTRQILDILNYYHAKATFFIEGQKIKNNESILHDIIQEQHVIANHGYSHQSLLKLNFEQIKDEIIRTHQLIENAVKISPVFFRPPYGRFNHNMKGILQELNYTMVLWDLMTYDFLEQDVNILQKRTLKHIKQGCILVNHDGHKNTPVLIKALPQILEKIIQRNLIPKALTKDVF